MFSQETVERHQNAGRAEAALERVIALERRLQNSEAVRRGRKAFNSSHLAAFDLQRERETGARRIAVDLDGACAADAMLATDMDGGLRQHLPQEIRHQHSRLSEATDVPLAPAPENIFAVLRHLALVQPLPPDPRQALLAELASSPETFKLIVTSQPRGSIPAEIWNSSYVVFSEELSS